MLLLSCYIICIATDVNDAQIFYCACINHHYCDNNIVKYSICYSEAKGNYFLSFCVSLNVSVCVCVFISRSEGTSERE